MSDYRTLADAVAAEIAAGKLRPGDRLPPQRDFAYRRGIAVSTAGRAYAELVRRGLVAGEVGRGTYVRATATTDLALTEPPAAAANLEINFPILPEQSAELAKSLNGLLRADGLEPALHPITATATPQARERTAAFLARSGWKPDPEGVLFVGNGRQAIAAGLAALAPVGERIGVEAVTYPVVKGIAARLGIILVPIALDGEGLQPEALAEAHATTPLRGVYLQPSLHNPLGITMSAARRAALAAVLEMTGLVAIEDAIYGFLADDAPLASWAPRHTILVDSLSKRLAPGLTLGFIAAPLQLSERIAAALRAGAWSAAGFLLAAGLQWMADGTASRIAAAKRADAAARQEIARDALADLGIKGDPRAYHLWLELSAPWRADAFVAAAARHRHHSGQCLHRERRPCAECRAPRTRLAAARRAHARLGQSAPHSAFGSRGRRPGAD